MKNFISKNWEKIMIFIGCVILLFMLVNKVAAEKTLIEDYAKYGKEVSSSSSAGTTVSGEGLSGTISNVSGEISSGNFFNIPIFQKYPELTKFALIFGVAILFVVFITSFVGMFGAKKDAKKKK
ncbi:MAG: hypothetical protein IKJ32_04170 [Clostridia bacterium]|nr:hypothetical protein [Clostridia bacterium]